MVNNWEQKDFVFEYNPGWSWVRIDSGSGNTPSEARQYFWQESQRFVLPKLQKWRDDGWEPVSEVGPSAIELRYYKSMGKTFGDKLLGFLALAVSLGFLVFWVRSEYVEPKEFRVTMRRKKT